MKNTVIFSPHCDDAALSLGGAIKNDLVERDICIYDIFSVFKRRINATWWS